MLDTGVRLLKGLYRFEKWPVKTHGMKCSKDKCKVRHSGIISYIGFGWRMAGKVDLLEGIWALW